MNTSQYTVRMDQLENVWYIRIIFHLNVKSLRMTLSYYDDFIWANGNIKKKKRISTMKRLWWTCGVIISCKCQSIQTCVGCFYLIRSKSMIILYATWDDNQNVCLKQFYLHFRITCTRLRKKIKKIFIIMERDSFFRIYQRTTTPFVFQ